MEKVAPEVAGNVNFKNTTIETNLKAPVQMRFGSKGELSGSIRGNLLIKSGQNTSTFDFASFISESKTRLKKLNALEPAVLKTDTLQIPASSKERVGNNTFYTHANFTFLQYAKKGQKIDFYLTGRQVYGSPTEVKVLNPAGKEVQDFAIPAYEKNPILCSFTAEKTGFYKIVRQGSSFRIDINSANPGNGFVTEGNMSFLPVGKARMYFAVPKGVSNFTIGITSDSTVNAALINPQGKTVEQHNNINSLQLFSAIRPDKTKSEIWSVEVDHAVWSVVLHLYKPLQPIVSTNPSTLLQQ